MTEAEFHAHLARDGYAEAAIVEMEPSAQIAAHEHDFDASVYVLSGKISVTTADGQTTTCGPDDTFALTAGTSHTEEIGADGVRFLAGRRQPA